MKLEKIGLVILTACLLLCTFKICSLSNKVKDLSDDYSKYSDSIMYLNKSIDTLNNEVYFREREIDNLKLKVDEGLKGLDKINDKYKSEKDRVKSLPTDSAIKYLERRLNED